MNNTLENIAKMNDITKAYYSDLITELKNEIFGYNSSLDYICNYHELQSSENINHSYKMVEKFTKEMSEYYTEKYNDYNNEQILFIQDLLITIVYYLSICCNKTDYTFLGVTKILGTFYNDNDSKLTESIFFYMLSKVSEEEINKLHTFTNNKSKEWLNSRLDWNDVRIVTDRLHTMIRIFLYINKLDYLSDEGLRICTKDILTESRLRLKNIYKNKKGNVYYEKQYRENKYRIRPRIQDVDSRD